MLSVEMQFLSENRGGHHGVPCSGKLPFLRLDLSKTECREEFRDIPESRGILLPGFPLALNTKPYLEGQGGLVSRLITPITQIVTPIIPIINLVTKPPDPPSKPLEAHQPTRAGRGLGFWV